MSDLLDVVEQLVHLKHQPGKHDKNKHDPTKGGKARGGPPGKVTLDI